MTEAKLLCPYCGQHLRGWDKEDVTWKYPNKRLRKGQWHHCGNCRSAFMLQEGIEALIEIQRS